MSLDELITLIVTPKIKHLIGFDKTDKRLLELADYLNTRYSPDLPWPKVLIAGKLFELEKKSETEITKSLIDKSIENFNKSNPPYQKDLEYFIISIKQIDGVEEYNSDLLAFSEL